MNANLINEYGVRLANGKIKDFKKLEAAEKCYQKELTTDLAKCGSLVELFQYTDVASHTEPIKSNM